jgi:hypothetical protein
MGSHVLQQTRRHALAAARAAHLRGDAAATGKENDENENVLVATSKSPSQLRRATSLHSRFTLRDLMRAPNAPLAQLRSPLRRADSLANHDSFVAPRNLSAESSDALANPFPPRKNKPATNLKTLLRRRSDDDRGDSENVDPRGVAVDDARGSNATKDGGFDSRGAAARAASAADEKPPAFPLPKLRVCSRPPANETDQPDSPAFVSAVPSDFSRGKRKAATEPEPLAETRESFSFFGDETKSENKKSSEASVSALERELAEAIRHEKAAAAAARASMSLGRWRLALEAQKARAETAAKTATLTEMLRDQAREFDEDKRSRKEELRGALSRAQALTRELAETNETVEILTEALGAATRERVAAQWRFSAKAATARAEAAAARRKMRRVVVECEKDAKTRALNPSADATTATKADAERHEPLPLEPPHRASLTESLREEIRDELRRELRKEVLKELRKSLRPIVEAEVRAEARDEHERSRDALGSYARMARIGLSVEANKYGSGVKRNGAFTESTSSFSNAGTGGDAAYAAPRVSAPREKKTTACASALSDSNKAAAMMAAARATRNAYYGTKNASRKEKEDAHKNAVNGSGSALSALAMQTVEAAAHARSRLNPLRGANVAELVALHEAAAAKLAAQAEELVHEAERVIFFPSFTECAVVEGAVIDVSSKKSSEERDKRAPRSDVVSPSFPPTALTPTTSAKVVVPKETSIGGVSQKSEPRGIEPATRTAQTAREPSVWDMWFT